MYQGFEIDMLSLEDADCIIVTEYPNHLPPMSPQRVLIDGGREADAPAILDFLRYQRMTDFWAAVCSHLHNDHVRGLIKVVRDRSITFNSAWMHDIRNHLLPDALRRATSGNSAEADSVRQVLENTRELASAFASRGITPREPFAGEFIAGYPGLIVLGPTESFYKKAIQEFTDEVPDYLMAALLGPLGGYQAPTSGRASLLPPPDNPYAIPLRGLLGNSSVEKEPTTQPFNNTSTILGVTYGTQKFLLTGDAGSEALNQIPRDWQHVDWMEVPHHGSDGNLSQANIERFHPKTAYVSAVGDTSHPSKAIVNGLIKLGATVYSTHMNGHLRHYIGNVPVRTAYNTAIPMKGSVETVINLEVLARLYGGK